MWDSNGHLPSGLLSSSFFSPGAYDECLSIKGENNDYQVNGQYCLLEIRSPWPMREVHFTNESQVKFFEPIVNRLTSMDIYTALATNGLCLPSTCSEKELADIVPKMFEMKPMRVNLRLCQKQTMAERPMRYGQKVAR